MKTRLALVCWWFGALIGGLAVAFGAAALIFDKSGDGGAIFGSAVIFAGLFVAPAWAIAFVLGGSFWKPPKAKQ